VLHCPVNILIENSETLTYLTLTGDWTKKPGDGKCFPTAGAALRAAKLEAIGKFNIVWHVPASGQFYNLDHGRGKGLPEAAVAG
jgi:hypothetical protein